MTHIDNILPRFVKDGQLTQDFSDFSKDELRMGLMMVIDNLERHDDAVALAVFTQENWRKPKTEDTVEKDWKKSKDIFNDDSETEGRGDEPWMSYRANGPNGTTVDLETLDRRGLIREIKQSWGHLQRAAEGAKVLMETIQKATSGHWFDPQVAEITAPTPQPRSAKRKP